MLLAGGDPAAWPNAELALEHIPALRAARASDPQLVDRDRYAELDGVGARAARYRTELARGDWQLPPHWTATPDPPPNPQEASTSMTHRMTTAPPGGRLPQSDRRRHVHSAAAACDRAAITGAVQQASVSLLVRAHLRICASAVLRVSPAALMRVRSAAHMRSWAAAHARIRAQRHLRVCAGAQLRISSAREDWR